MKAPAFWTEDGALAHLLAPLGVLYTLGGRWHRRAATPWQAPAPVVCIGNLTVGGAGKTPTALAIARRLMVALLPGKEAGGIERFDAHRCPRRGFGQQHR